MIGAAFVTAITWSTPNPVPFFLIGFLIVYFGGRIEERLARVPSTSGLYCGVPDHFLHIETNSFFENEFKVWFVDGEWEAGRSFAMVGKIVNPPGPARLGCQMR